MCFAYRSCSTLILCFRSFDASVTVYVMYRNSQKVNERKLMDEFFVVVICIRIDKEQKLMKRIMTHADINDVTDTDFL